jgi:parvulin-like peptidyl-prolyl isomerase
MVPRGDLKPCDGTRILARIGSDAILESEVAGAVNESVNEIVEKNKDKISPEQLEQLRTLRTQQRLKNLIDTKLIYQDAKHNIPTEGWAHIEQELSKQFEGEGGDLDKMMKKAGVGSRRELDQKLRSLGTSLEQEKRSSMELTLARQWMGQQIKRDEEVTYDQMVFYYHDHVKEFTTSARAQWEELLVRYAKYPTRAAAYEAIARMGNQIWAGTPFGDVAKTGSDGPEAPKGGRRDWTAKGALACQALDTALFNLPVGQLSPIIEGDRGFHIIRVTRREPDTVKPFTDTQAEIKKKIVSQRMEKQFQEYMAKLQARTPVWTIFDSPTTTPQTATPGPPLRR